MKVSRRTTAKTMVISVGSAALAKLKTAEDTVPGKPAAMPSKANEASSGPVCLTDFEFVAKERLSHFVYEYVAGGAADELTMRWNRESYDQIRLRPRALVDVEKTDPQIKLFGQELPHPILLAPVARHRLAHPEGEVATARGAGMAGAPFVISSLSTRRLQDIAAAAKAPLWFQLYDLRPERREFVRDVVKEAERFGCHAFVVTVDAPVDGARNRIQRLGYRVPADLETPYFQNSKRSKEASFPGTGSFTWEAIEWLLSVTRLPILLKGIINPEDANLAVRTGVGGIIVSNHGGRCLDTLPASIDALAPVVEKVAGRLPVLVDGGIRRGTDVLKAIALGAAAVLIGRPYVYGLAVNGAEGVAKVVNILRDEFQIAMALTGRATIKSIDRSVLWD